MWQVDNRTPFAADRTWVRDRHGAEVWLVAVKCTFDIAPDGTTTVSEEQPPVLRVPEHHGEPGKSSLRFDSDLVLTKTTTDVIVVGHAHAPDGKPVTVLDVGFQVGPIQKVLKVHGDRVWTENGPSAPEPFVKLPLVYERAFGGVDQQSEQPDRDWDWRNPVGTGFGVARENLIDVPVPNIEHRNELIAKWEDRPRPAGFGAIAGHWQPRAGLTGTYDDQWMQHRRPLLPEDFDDRFFQCAPEDQQAPEFLRGGEPVVLARLTPEADVRFPLPTVSLAFETRFIDGSRELHDASLHTVIIEADVPRISLVWHTALRCHFKVRQLERTIVTLKATADGGASSVDSGELERV